jgi:hypothetical protein
LTTFNGKQLLETATPYQLKKREGRHEQEANVMITIFANFRRKKQCFEIIFLKDCCSLSKKAKFVWRKFF